ncbi:DUF3604 domain-containing protein [Candidatus Woesearchaeota archaeon]|jgi:hypothetical protein|nr:DUF3604 domain-containing protein [Candidatus Woesearchaeota archaeon]MBT6045010.1 DUF3604 domain-containing protein [Candidatus Woesearchaeota archaeon]
MKKLLIFGLFILILASFVNAQVDYQGENFFASMEHEGNDRVFTTMYLNYTLSQDFGDDGQVRIYLGNMWKGEPNFKFRYGYWNNFNLNKPTLQGYSTVQISGREFTLYQPNGLDLKPSEFGFEVHQSNNSNSFKAGDIIQFTLGDTSQGSKGYKLSRDAAEINIFVQEKKNSSSQWELAYNDSIFPKIEVSGTNTERFKVVSRSAGNIGEKMKLRVQALQGFPDNKIANPLVRNYTGTIGFYSKDPTVILPNDYTFTYDDRGVAELNITPGKKGLLKIFVYEKGNQLVNGTVNPIIVRGDGKYKDYSVYWGAIHTHSSIGGHALHTTDFAYDWAHNVEGLDFFSIAEHCSKKSLELPFDWKKLKDYGVDYSDPNEFIAFSGYEWTSNKEGHRHVILKNAEEWDEVPCNLNSVGTYTLSDIDDLLNNLTGTEALAIPHHTGWNFVGAVKWGSWKDHPNQPLVEMYSWHGGSEFYDSGLPMRFSTSNQHPKGSGFFVQEALKDGYKFGFTSDSDNHVGKPASNTNGGTWDNYYSRMGITGVYTKEYSRDAIWDALNNRRTYGTTGARILGYFRINGRFVGSEFNTSRNPRIDVKLYGTDEFSEVFVYRNGEELVYYDQPLKKNVQFKWTDNNVTSGESYSYYVKGIQEDGERVWISPIWVNYL